jgi:hypothetical protein
MSLKVGEENWVMIGDCTTQVVESIEKIICPFYLEKLLLLLRKMKFTLKS